MAEACTMLPTAYGADDTYSKPPSVSTMEAGPVAEAFSKPLTDASSSGELDIFWKGTTNDTQPCCKFAGISCFIPMCGLGAFCGLRTSWKFKPDVIEYSHGCCGSTHDMIPMRYIERLTYSQPCNMPCCGSFFNKGTLAIHAPKHHRGAVNMTTSDGKGIKERLLPAMLDHAQTGRLEKEYLSKLIANKASV